MDDHMNLTSGPRARLTVEPAQTGFRADRALATLLPDCGRRGAKTLWLCYGGDIAHAGLVLFMPELGVGHSQLAYKFAYT